MSHCQSVSRWSPREAQVFNNPSPRRQPCAVLAYCYVLMSPCATVSTLDGWCYSKLLNINSMTHSRDYYAECAAWLLCFSSCGRSSFGCFCFLALVRLFCVVACRHPQIQLCMDFGVFFFNICCNLYADFHYSQAGPVRFTVYFGAACIPIQWRLVLWAPQLASFFESRTLAWSIYSFISF